jgi:hypothetical protein
MEHYIKKNILIDDLLDLNISYIRNLSDIKEILDIFNLLRETNNIDIDIELLNRVLYIIDENIFEAEEYLKNFYEAEYNYANVCLNEYYLYKHKIQSFINEINIDDHLIDLISEINIK